jgi:hypothetical protein
MERSLDHDNGDGRRARLLTGMPTPSELMRASGVAAGTYGRRSSRSNATKCSKSNKSNKWSGIVHETADQTGECLMLGTRFTSSEEISEFDFGHRSAG